MDPTHEPNSFAHVAVTVKSALLAIVLRHYGLELRQEPATPAEGITPRRVGHRGP
jgi:hypothetical protein